MALSHLVVQYESNFCTVALQFMEEEKNYPLPSPAATGGCLCGQEMYSLRMLRNLYLRSLPNRMKSLLAVINPAAPLLRS